MADDGVLVAGAEGDDPVVAPEGLEEANLELGVGAAIDDAGSAASHFFGPVERGFAATVDDGDLAVRAHGVGGRGSSAAALERLREARDLYCCAPLRREQHRQRAGGVRSLNARSTLSVVTLVLIAE